MGQNPHRLAVGERAPRFELPVISTGAEPAVLALPDSQASATVIVFHSAGCPFALAWHDRVQQVARDYAPAGVSVLQVISNHAADRPQDDPTALREWVAAGEVTGPLLHDAEQAAARGYGATATPEVFVIDAEGVLRYHGAPDADHADPTHNAGWLRAALDDLLAGRPVARESSSPAGCSIKWRVELLWWDGCPSHGQAEDLLRETLAELGRDDVHLVRRQVRTRAEADQLGFPGSPSIQVGRVDLFPSDDPPTLACRIYRADGRPAALPSKDDLSERLRDALARPWDLPGWIDPRHNLTLQNGVS